MGLEEHIERSGVGPVTRDHDIGTDVLYITE